MHRKSNPSPDVVEIYDRIRRRVHDAEQRRVVAYAACREAGLWPFQCPEVGRAVMARTAADEELEAFLSEHPEVQR